MRQTLSLKFNFPKNLLPSHPLYIFYYNISVRKATISLFLPLTILISSTRLRMAIIFTVIWRQISYIRYTCHTQNSSLHPRNYLSYNVTVLAPCIFSTFNSLMGVWFISQCFALRPSGNSACIFLLKTETGQQISVFLTFLSYLSNKK